MFNLLLFCLVLQESPVPSKLVAEAAIGDDQQWVFGVGTQCVVNAQGTMYLLDPASFQIQIFDEDFRSIGRFGRRGKGPGEFEEPKTLAMTPSGQLAVFDPTLKRMTLFDAKGMVLETHRLDSASVAIYQPAVLKNGNVAFLSARSDEGKPVYDITLYDPNLSHLKTLDRVFATPMDWQKASQPRFWVDFLKNEMEMTAKGMPVLCSPDPSTILVARANRYEIALLNAEGDRKGNLRRKVKPLPMSDALKTAMFEEVWVRLASDPFLANNMPESVFKRAVAEADTPPAARLIKAILPLADGFAVLVNYHPLKREGVLDLFALDGTYLTTLGFEGPAHFLTGTRTHLYAIGPDLEDRIIVRRYRLE